jgi:hypothetical protein
MAGLLGLGVFDKCSCLQLIGNNNPNFPAPPFAGFDFMARHPLKAFGRPGAFANGQFFWRSKLVRRFVWFLFLVGRSPAGE